MIKVDKIFAIRTVIVIPISKAMSYGMKRQYFKYLFVILETVCFDKEMTYSKKYVNSSVYTQFYLISIELYFTT